MAKVIKTLRLHRHTDKDSSGQHISFAGAQLANQCYQHYPSYYEPVEVDHLFYGPLIRTLETVIAMMTKNPAFKKAQIHGPIDGLGSDELFATLVTDEVRRLIKDGRSNYEAVMMSHDNEVLRPIFVGFVEALEQMFEQMDEGQLGVGVFHDPTIPMAAIAVGMGNARSLESMEAITFRLHEDGVIQATWEYLNIKD